MKTLLKEAYDMLCHYSCWKDTETHNLIHRIRNELNKIKAPLSVDETVFEPYAYKAVPGAVNYMKEPKPMNFDPTKPVQLRNGWKAVISETFTDGFGITMHFGRYHDKNNWFPYRWKEDGSDWKEQYHNPLDLINIPEPKEVAEFWCNLYEKPSGRFDFGACNKLQEDCLEEKHQHFQKLFACIKISCTRGEGLT